MRDRLLAFTLAGACGLYAGGASADFAGLELGAAGWDHQPSGTVRYQPGSLSTEVDLEDDLGLESKAEGMFWAEIEHPVPILPNVRLQYSAVSHEGTGRAQTAFVFGGQTYTATETVDSTLDLDQLDATLYYEVLDNVVDLDLGLNVKGVDGFARVRGRTSGNDESVEFEGYIPMVYGKVGVDLPLSGLSANVTGSAISYDGNSLQDITARIRYQTDMGLGVEGGYRRQTLELDDVDDVFSDITIDGPYLGVFLRI